MHNGIPIWIFFLQSPPVCIWGPPYAYGDPFMQNYPQDLISHMEIFPVCIRLVTEISPYAYGERTNPRMNMGIMCHAIPVCIRGSQWSPYAYGDQDQSSYAYRDCMSCNPRMHTGISVLPICIRGLILIPVCICELQGVIGSYHGESLCLFLEEVLIILLTTNKQGKSVQ